jgi:pimeloyl-ACP methyl ester carboxylesterase
MVEPAGDLQVHFLTVPYSNKSLKVRVGVQNPEGVPLGDVIYVHGFADRLDNHGPLFQSWTKAGFRVIAFDLPSHGEDSGSYDNLNNFSFQDLAKLIATVEHDTKPTTPCPLLLSGWSTGGLIVVRMLQENWTSDLSRPVSGAILFAPGVSVRKFPWTFGNRLGEVTSSTLTHDPNPPHVGPIDPNSPFWSKLAFEFAPRLVGESVLSQNATYPINIPTLVFSGGDREDMYAKARIVRQWVDDQNSPRKTSGELAIMNISCPHAMHEMDNELPSYGGVEVRNTAAAFAKSVITETIPNLTDGPGTFGSACSRVDR